jgi:hypothetical protein
MKKSFMKKSLWILLGLSLLTLGCQTGSPLKEGESTSFSALWRTYGHCHAETDLEELRRDASVLQAAANRSVSPDGFVIPLPGKIERLVSTPSARLAVDVKAMAASCSLRAGQTAARVGKVDVARSLLESIFEYHPQSDYAYYSAQAKSMLLELDPPSNITVSLRIP